MPVSRIKSVVLASRERKIRLIFDKFVIDIVIDHVVF